MKITAGMGSLDDYIEYVKAGADEIFIGYVPQKWIEIYGTRTPLNRREVCYYNVQIGAAGELEILSDLVSRYHVPVTIAFNGLNFAPEEYPLIDEIIRDCLDLGFDSVILSDPALLLYLHDTGTASRLKIHLSGEFGEMNHYILEHLVSLDVSRIIFHRKISLPTMQRIITRLRNDFPGKCPEFEAFILNENCQFHGGYCNSLHCDELVPMCRMPYKLSMPYTPGTHCKSRAFYELEATGTSCECDPDQYYTDIDSALETMERIGITHLKIVGRGAHSEDMINDIRMIASHIRNIRII